MQRLRRIRKKSKGGEWEDPFDADLENDEFKEMMPFVACLEDMEEHEEGI
jgi:hypothetical protein